MHQHGGGQLCSVATVEHGASAAVGMASCVAVGMTLRLLQAEREHGGSTQLQQPLRPCTRVHAPPKVSSERGTMTAGTCSTHAHRQHARPAPSAAGGMWVLGARVACCSSVMPGGGQHCPPCTSSAVSHTWCEPQGSSLCGLSLHAVVTASWQPHVHPPGHRASPALLARKRRANAARLQAPPALLGAQARVWNGWRPGAGPAPCSASPVHAGRPRRA